MVKMKGKLLSKMGWWNWHQKVLTLGCCTLLFSWSLSAELGKARCICLMLYGLQSSVTSNNLISAPEGTSSKEHLQLEMGKQRVINWL